MESQVQPDIVMVCDYKKNFQHLHSFLFKPVPQAVAAVYTTCYWHIPECRL